MKNYLKLSMIVGSLMLLSTSLMAEDMPSSPAASCTELKTTEACIGCCQAQLMDCIAGCKDVMDKEICQTSCFRDKFDQCGLSCLKKKP